MKSKINLGWIKYLIVFLFIITIFSLNRIDINACGTGRCYRNGHSEQGVGSYCPCGAGHGNPCELGCDGHCYYCDPRSDERVKSSTSGKNADCEHNGQKSQITYESGKYCHWCGGVHYVSERTVEGNENVNATGHNWSPGWYVWNDANDSYHEFHCTNSWHAGCDGQKSYTESHNHNTYAGNWSHYDHYDCSACGHRNTYTEINLADITFIDPAGGNSGAYTKSCYAPGSTDQVDRTAGRHLIGYVKNTDPRATTHHTEYLYGETVRADWAPGTGSNLHDWVVRYYGYDRCENNHTGNNGTFVGLWIYNNVEVRYHLGYGTSDSAIRNNYFTKRYVDVTQTLTTMNYNGTDNYENRTYNFTRTGYDIVDNGWFTSESETYTDCSWSSKGSCDSSSYTSYNHRAQVTKQGSVSVKTSYNYGELYSFNTSYRAINYASNIYNTPRPTRDLYLRWRAHKLTVNYNLNGGYYNNRTDIGAIPATVMWYSDGQGKGENNNRTTYSITTILPIRTGYVFMGWGNNTRWDSCNSGTKGYDVYGELNNATRYAAGNVGTSMAYDNTSARNVAMTAEAWSAFGGKDLRSLRPSRKA